jgi:hypothetical protein
LEFFFSQTCLASISLNKKESFTGSGPADQGRGAQGQMRENNQTKRKRKQAQARDMLGLGRKIRKP